MLLKVSRCLDKLAPSEEIGPKKKGIEVHL